MARPLEYTGRTLNFSSMDSVYSLCGSVAAPIDSKGSAISFAIVMCSSFSEKSKTRSVDYKKAQKLFDFICSNVKLPDVKPDGMEQAGAMINGLIESLRMQKTETSTC